LSWHFTKYAAPVSGPRSPSTKLQIEFLLALRGYLGQGVESRRSRGTVRCSAPVWRSITRRLKLHNGTRDGHKSRLALPSSKSGELDGVKRSSVRACVSSCLSVFMVTLPSPSYCIGSGWKNWNCTFTLLYNGATINAQSQSCPQNPASLIPSRARRTDLFWQ